MPAHFHVFRGKDGVAIVRPGAVVVQLQGGHANVQVRNFTPEWVTAVFPNPNPGNAPVIITVAPNSKNQPPTDLGAFGIGFHTFHMYVGSEEAQGNSAPTLIIDD